MALFVQLFSIIKSGGWGYFEWLSDRYFLKHCASCCWLISGRDSDAVNQRAKRPLKSNCRTETKPKNMRILSWHTSLVVAWLFETCITNHILLEYAANIH